MLSQHSSHLLRHSFRGLTTRIMLSASNIAHSLYERENSQTRIRNEMATSGIPFTSERVKNRDLGQGEQDYIRIRQGIKMMSLVSIFSNIMGKDPYNRTLVLFSRGKLTRNYIPEVVGTLATFSAGYGLLGMISYPAILAYLATMGVVIMFRNGQLATQCSPQISAVYVTESGKISIDVIKGAVPADYDPLFKNNQVKLEQCKVIVNETSKQEVEVDGSLISSLTKWKTTVQQQLKKIHKMNAKLKKSWKSKGIKKKKIVDKTQQDKLKATNIEGQGVKEKNSVNKKKRRSRMLVFKFKRPSKTSVKFNKLGRKKNSLKFSLPRSRKIISQAKKCKTSQFLATKILAKKLITQRHRAFRKLAKQYREIYKQQSLLCSSKLVQLTQRRAVLQSQLNNPDPSMNLLGEISKTQRKLSQLIDKITQGKKIMSVLMASYVRNQRCRMLRYKLSKKLRVMPQKQSICNPKKQSSFLKNQLERKIPYEQLTKNESSSKTTTVKPRRRRGFLGNLKVNTGKTMIISRKDKIPRLNTRKNIAKFNTNGPLIFRKFMKLLKSERKLFKIGIRSKLAKLISRRKLSKFGRKSPFLKVKKLFEVSCFDKNLLTQWQEFSRSKLLKIDRIRRFSIISRSRNKLLKAKKLFKFFKACSQSKPFKIIRISNLLKVDRKGKYLNSIQRVKKRIVHLYKNMAKYQSKIGKKKNQKHSPRFSLSKSTIKLQKTKLRGRLFKSSQVQNLISISQLERASNNAKIFPLIPQNVQLIRPKSADLLLAAAHALQEKLNHIQKLVQNSNKQSVVLPNEAQTQQFLNSLGVANIIKPELVTLEVEKKDFEFNVVLPDTIECLPKILRPVIWCKVKGQLFWINNEHEIRYNQHALNNIL